MLNDANLNATAPASFYTITASQILKPTKGEVKTVLLKCKFEVAGRLSVIRHFGKIRPFRG